MTGEREWFGLGETQHIQSPPDRLEAAYAYAVKSETHLWIASLMHRVSDVSLDRLAGEDPEPMLLDSETLMMTPLIGCYVCEEPYAARLRHRKCPGEPKGGGRR